MKKASNLIGELGIEKFDKIAENYASGYDDDSYFGYVFRIRKKRVLELFDKESGKVLDIGCGPGVMVEDLLKLDCSFWGLDSSTKMIEECIKNFGNNDRTHFSIGDATCIDFPDNTFDAVICMGVIEFVDDGELAISEMVRVLRRHGTLVIAFPYEYCPYNLWKRFLFNPVIRPAYYLMTRQEPKLDSLIRDKAYAEKTVGKLLRRNHCEVCGLVHFGFNLFLKPLDFSFPYLTGWVSKRLEHLCRGKLRWLGSSFVVKAIKL